MGGANCGSGMVTVYCALIPIYIIPGGIGRRGLSSHKTGDVWNVRGVQQLSCAGTDRRWRVWSWQRTKEEPCVALE